MCDLDIFCKQTDCFFNFIIISETWANDNSAALINLENHNFIYKNRTEKKGGGVGIFVKHGIEYTVINNKVFEDNAIDILCIQIKSKHVLKATCLTNIIAIYRPPNVNFDYFIERFIAVLDFLNPNQETYIVGDVNVNLLDLNSQTYSFKNLLYSHYFVPLITSPTRITATTSSLLDNIFTNNLEHLNQGIIVSDFSDHYPIFSIASNITKITISNKPTLKRLLTKKSINSINIALSEVDWSPILSEKNVDSALEKFYSKINSIIDNLAPLKLIKQRNKKNWVTNKIISMSNKKSKLFKKSKNKPTWKNLSKYKQYKNYFTTTVRKAQQNYYHSKLISSKNNIKEKWNIIKNILNKNTNSNNLNKLLVDGEYIEDKTKICNQLNLYYVNVAEEILKINKNNFANDTQKYTINFKNSNTIYFDPTDNYEINTIVKNLNNKKSTSHDNISSNLIKHIITHILTPLTHIFNLSISQGVFPTFFKTSKVIPIYKKGNPEEMTNYRPISLLPSFSKILEKIITIRLNSFVKSNNILSDKQYGFRANHSTELALIEFTQEIMNNMNNKILSLGVFIDLSKAFDLINHENLLQKLNLYGIRGHANQWLQSYLSHRKQYVSLDQFNSDVLDINYGVPQGSILGPLLFIIYINDLCSNFPQTNFILFADDTNIFFPTINPMQDADKINNELSNISSWFNLNKLVINHAKSSYIIFGPKILTNNIPNLEIKINNQILQKSSSIKFLGILIKENLKWNDHIITISLKINKMIGILRKIKFKINNETLILLYYSLIYPHLTYCITLWGNSPAAHLNILNKSQNRFIRLLLNIPTHFHISPYYPLTNILNLNQIYTLYVSIFVHKFLHNQLPNYFKNFFIHSNLIKSKTTRQKSIFYTPTARLKLICTSIKHTGPRIWETMIPEHIININSFPLFKNKLKQYLILQNTTFKP